MFIQQIKKIRLSLAVIVLLLPASSVASFDSVYVEINTGAYIFDGSSNVGRVLLSFNLPDQLSNAEIFYAELVVPITSYIPDSSALMVLLHPLLISWDQNVSWNDIGDSMTNEIISGEGSHYATSEEGSQNAYFDITRIVTAWKERRITNNGAILFCPSDEPSYFRYIRNGNVPFAGATIYYDR